MITISWLMVPANFGPRRSHSSPLTIRNEATLKLFLGANLPIRENLRAMERQREIFVEQKQILAGHEEAMARERDGSEQWEYYYLTLRLGQSLNGARLRWCEEAIAALNRAGRRKTRKPASRKKAGD